ncbi:glycerol-3-phosphate 1-O-acyltransferase PlsY [Brevundimonas poindexterae]|uniref:glycerol-3-phosphate 1-O-acyltransferase PlsY n=1 Tax=Brevundimonas poindexterae TaxID=74325 RepID=UPI001CFE74CC|nr:glycerol-3-phosphate 1-O-acyltransferase PlsY [Brevundimonas poindexterae]
MQDLAGIAVTTLLGAALAGYLLGSIPFGVLLTRAAGAGDVRKIGSGNIGATNVLRTGRKDLAFATLILDAGKGAAALLIARAVTGSDVVAAIAGGAAFLGHLYPVWLGFKGGKGVATFFGLMLAAAWPLGLVAAAVWLLTAAVFRISSLSALVATVLTPILALMPIATLGPPAPDSVFLLALFAMTLIWLRHFDNIIRLIRGKEPRIGARPAG